MYDLLVHIDNEIEATTKLYTNKYTVMYEAKIEKIGLRISL